MNQLEVYEAITRERIYQDKVWENKLKVGEHVALLNFYVQELNRAWTVNSGDFMAMEVIRKIAGICVRCMEQNDFPERKFDV